MAANVAHGVGVAPDAAGGALEAAIVAMEVPVAPAPTYADFHAGARAILEGIRFDHLPGALRAVLRRAPTELLKAAVGGTLDEQSESIFSAVRVIGLMLRPSPKQPPKRAAAGTHPHDAAAIYVSKLVQLLINDHISDVEAASRADTVTAHWTALQQQGGQQGDQQQQQHQQQQHQQQQQPQGQQQQQQQPLGQHQQQQPQFQQHCGQQQEQQGGQQQHHQGGQQQLQQANPTQLQAAIALLLQAVGSGGLPALLSGGGGSQADAAAAAAEASRLLAQEAERARRRDTLQDRLFPVVKEIFDSLDAPVSPAGGLVRPVEDDRRLGRALVTACGGTPENVRFPEGDSEATRVEVRETTYIKLLEACAQDDSAERQWTAFVDFLQAVRHVVISRSGLVACSWATFARLALTDTSGQYQPSLERTLSVFRSARWTQSVPMAPPAPSGVHPPLPAAGLGAVPSQPHRTVGSAGPTRTSTIASAIVIGEESDDDDEGRARAQAGDVSTGGRRVIAPLGELSPSYMKLYATYVTKLRLNVDVAPRPAERGGDTWSASFSRADIIAMAHDTVTGAYSISLDDIYGNFESVRLSPAATLPRAFHDDIFCQALSKRDVVLNCHSSFGVNAVRRVAATSRQLIGISLENGLMIPDVRQVSSFPSHASSLRGWFYENIEPLVGVVIQVALLERPEMSPAPSTEDVLPDVSLVPIILNAIADTVTAATMKWRCAPVRFLIFFLLCEWVFRGRVHLRLHPALEAVISTLLSVVSAAGSSSERWPNYIDYSCGRANFVPMSWQTPKLVQLGTVGKAPATGTALAIPRTTVAVSKLHKQPWAVRNPHAPRTSDCPYCGPGVAHSLASCESYSAYKQAGGQRVLPSIKFFPVGQSYCQALAAQAVSLPVGVQSN